MKKTFKFMTYICSIMLVVLAVSLVMVGCQNTNSQTFSVTASVEQGEGTITGAGTYKKGDLVNITAVPKEGYFFDSWSNGETASNITMNIKSDFVISARFVKGVRVSLNNGKSVTVRDGKLVSSSGDYYEIKVNDEKAQAFGYWENVADGTIYSADSYFSIWKRASISNNIKLQPVQSACGMFLATMNFVDSLGGSIKTLTEATSISSISQGYYYNYNGKTTLVNTTIQNGSATVKLNYNSSSDFALYSGKIFIHNNQCMVAIGMPSRGSLVTSIQIGSQTCNIVWSKA